MAEKSRCTNSISQEHVQERIQHAICHHHQSKSEVEHSVNAFSRRVLEFVEDVNPMWKATHQKDSHEDEDDFKHSNLTLFSLCSTCHDY